MAYTKYHRESGKSDWNSEMGLGLSGKLKSLSLSENEDTLPLVPPVVRKRNIFLATLSALLFIVSLGMVSSYSSPAAVDMLRYGSRFIHITTDEITWIASLPPLAGVFGNAASGYISHKLGRKAVLMYISAFYTISWLVIAYAPILIYVYVGRIVSGFCAGICAVAVPAYIVEISTVEIRGFLSAGFQVAFTFGVFLVMSFGIFFRWSWLAVTGAVVVVIGGCLMLFMPESPLWLIRTSMNTEAIKGLKFLKGKHHDAVAEFKEIVEQLADEPQTGITWRELLEPTLYKPMCIAVALMFFQQFSGINALMSYSVEIFQTTKSFLNPAVAATIIALVQLLMTASSSLLMDRAGRRALYITSGICMSVSLIVFGVYSYFSVKYEIAVHWNWVPLVCFALYIASFSLGFGPIPFVVTPEMVPTRSRSFLLALASVCCSFFGFVVTKVFDNMRSAMGIAGVYWTYGAFAFLGSVFYWIFIPETKGLTIHEIHTSFSFKGSASK